MAPSSRLNAPEIRAVLEANRAKIALLQEQQRRQLKQDGARGSEAGFPDRENRGRDVTRIGAERNQGGLRGSGDGSDASVHVSRTVPEISPRGRMRQKLHSNPVYGDAAAVSTPASGSGHTTVDENYAPKLRDAIRSPPVSGVSSGAKLPPLGDLFSHAPQLPLGIDINPKDKLFPSFPSWDAERMYLTKCHAYSNEVDGSSKDKNGTMDDHLLDAYPPAIQESMLINDLLHAFDGMNGNWIRCHISDAGILEYRVVARGQLEPALLEMATRMLPICECVAVVQRFVETRRQYPWGLVCQALAGAMRSVLQDWSLMIAQLEHQLHIGKLTIQGLWYYVQPPMSALMLVASLAAEASSKRLRGASLLDMLHSQTSSLLGDASSFKLAQRLLKAAAEPYFAVLERWIYYGEIDDPYGEFLIKEDLSIEKHDLTGDGASAFWFDRWTFRMAVDPMSGIQTGTVEVPSFLMKAKDAILNAGKCINLVRSCGKEPEKTLSAGTILTCDEGSRYLLHIHEANRIASSSAMKYLREEIAAYGSGLAVFKRYFLSSQGDLFLAVMDGGEMEFGRQAGQIELPQLQNILDIAVRGSSAATDPAAVNLKAAYDHRSMLNMLIAITSTSTLSTRATDNSSIPNKDKKPRLQPVVPAPMTSNEKATVGRQKRARESFMLSYEVPWPISVVVPDAAMAHYQMIFRHIFELKWVERELNRVCGMYRSTVPVFNARRRSTRRESLIPGSAAAIIAESLEHDSPSTVSVALVESYRTCQLMTHFFRQYLLYATFEVLEPLWNALEQHIQSSSTVDEIIEHHRVFLRKVMKGLLLSRKVVVLRALLSLKELALSFVNMSTKYVDLDYDALDAEAEASGLLMPTIVIGKDGKQKEQSPSTRERHLIRQLQIRRALESNLSKIEFRKGVTELREKFETRCNDFMSALKEAHMQAQSDRSDTREELESLVNLTSRLNFNGYFTNTSDFDESGSRRTSMMGTKKN